MHASKTYRLGMIRNAMRIAWLTLAFVCLGGAAANAQGVPAACEITLDGSAVMVRNNFSSNSCVACGQGTVTLTVANTLQDALDDVDYSSIIASQDFGTSGLTIVPNSTTFSFNNAAFTPTVQATVVGGSGGTEFEWVLDSSFTLPEEPTGPGSTSSLTITYQVEWPNTAQAEDIWASNRTITPSVELNPSCAPLIPPQPLPLYERVGATGQLDLDEPDPRIQLRGRNLDAGQGGNQYSDPVYGHENDDVIWRIRVRNQGQAPLQDLEFSKEWLPGNFEMSRICTTQGAAVNNTAALCSPLGDVSDFTDFDVEGTFGGGPDLVGAGGTRYFWVAGRITGNCTTEIGTVSNAEWGCETDTPTGGISSTLNTGVNAHDDSATLSTNSNENALDIDVDLDGINGNPQMGARGTVIINIRNQTGGTIFSQDGIDVRNLLPVQYVVDTTVPPVFVMDPAYGTAYDGMVDTMSWDNPAAGTLPLTTTDPAVALSNTDLLFTLTSSPPNAGSGDKVNMIRHGDVATITVRVVQIDPQYYDITGNLDVRLEDPASDPLNTDPTEEFGVTSRTWVYFEDYCDGTGTTHEIIDDQGGVADPEDLDVDLIGDELLFILTDLGDPLTLTAQVTNNGGHDADNYELYVTFGAAMAVQAPPPTGCVVDNARLLPEWKLPAGMPASATVYRCDGTTIGRNGGQRTFAFDVRKNQAPVFDDDLTFRADVIGESHLGDGTPLWFPAPIGRVDLITDRANNYSLDGVRSRGVGYNLNKAQVGDCSETNWVPGNPDDHVQIGEECVYNVESGGWFGFLTPGFTYIAVQDIMVEDLNPAGQTYISSTPYTDESTPAIQGVSLNLPATPLTDGGFNWRFNTDTNTERISVKDHWFRTDFTARLLNAPLNSVGAPNAHALPSTNVLTSTFEAVFFNPNIGGEEIFVLDEDTYGFPDLAYRTVQMRVTEPQLTIVKTVCNETDNGIGDVCDTFLPLVNDGDAFDTYVFRIEVTNRAADGGFPRSPAFDVTVTSVADDSLLVDVLPLAGDTVDNDGDGAEDGFDGDGEGTLIDNDVPTNTPANVIASYTHSAALRQINPGQTVTLYYRVDPDDTVSPLQQLTHTVTASFDSLEGDSGNQTAPQQPNGDAAGSRQYVSAPAEATIQIIPVEVSPKEVIRTSLSPVTGIGVSQPAVIGEELEYQLEALIPVAQLRDFVIRDELPLGLSCAEAPDVDLGPSGPHAAANFVPGGVFTPTCTDTEVIWNFTDQTVTTSDRADRRFQFQVQFIGRVENVDANRNGVDLVNGGGGSTANVEYVNEAGGDVVLPIGAATVNVREPALDLTKAFSVAQADAGDLPRVTVTLVNPTLSTAYNVRVLEDLTDPDLTFAGDIQGATPPTADTATFGVDQPLFTWTPGLSIAPGASVSFSFAVLVEGTVEPNRILDNTVQAAWTSLPVATTALNGTGTIGLDGAADGMRIGALPNAGDLLNNYEIEALATVEVPPLVVTKTDLDVALDPEIGTHKTFEIVIELPEGVTQGVVVDDALDALGAADVSYVLAHDATRDITYQFDGIAQINGAAPSEAVMLAVPGDGESGTVTWNIGQVVTTTEDDLAASTVTPTIRIRYEARIENDTNTDAGDALQNVVTTNYVHGETTLTASIVANTAPVAAIEPVLSATKVLANVTPGKLITDPPAFDDVLEYVVRITNGGVATAYDVNIVDNLPAALELLTTPVPTAMLNGVTPIPIVGIPAGSPDGPLIWGRGNGDDSIDIPTAAYVDLTYQVHVRTALPDPEVLTNRVWVDWTSLDGASTFERTGAGCPLTTDPNDYCFGPASVDGNAVAVPPPAPVLKANTQATASVGESFRYRITVPSTPYAFPIWDVQIQDNLAASLADLRFVSVTKVSPGGSWTPVNSGTDKSLIIEDTTDGIDIPAGEQVVLDITVVVEDTVNNAIGLAFTNAATHVYNWVDGDVTSQRPGMPGVTAPMTIVGPDTLVMDKDGPAQVTVGIGISYTLDLQNTGGGRAFDLTIVDLLPNTVDGGTCETAPGSIVARVFEADRVTPASALLQDGLDYTTAFLGAPTCRLELAMTSTESSVGPGQRLIVTYDAVLDADTADAVMLTNYAGATTWFSAESADAHEYVAVVDDGSPADTDHQDLHVIATALPQYRFDKTVSNLTTLQDPASEARPGDTLHYVLEVENLGNVSGSVFSLVDELDALNATLSFMAGSIANVIAPPGSTVAITAGPQGTGRLEVSGLDLPNLGDALVVEFDATLAAVIPAASVVANQAQLVVAGTPFTFSDDPGINPAPDPLVPGDEDPTSVTILSAPSFQIEKTSAYLTGDPALLLAGESIRYTITVKNIGTDDAIDATLRDSVPVGTTYVVGSTTLNGAPVADAVGGTSPLGAGLLLSAPEDPTPGAMRADDTATITNVATLVFDVVVDVATADGTVVSNQAFVSAVVGGAIDQPSDDPATTVVGDPTRDVVGNLPLLFASKDVVVSTDNGVIGVVDGDDVLQYTITVQNSGAIPATAVVLSDVVPANTTWVEDSLTLNGQPAGQPDGGVSPLIAGLAISSNDLPNPPAVSVLGVVSPGESAVIVFELLVDTGVANGTVISNQATVTTAELPNLLTDGDGNPTTGPEPTVVVVGDAQQLVITKTVTVVGGGAALAGSGLEYEVRVTNVATVPADNVVITDDLAVPVGGQMVFIPGSATMNGTPLDVTLAGSLLTADFSASGGPLQPGETVIVRFRATLDAALIIGTPVVNEAIVSWGAPVQTATAQVTIAVGGMPGVGVLSGALWHDADFDGVQGAGELALDGWTVQFLRSGSVAFTTTSDASGVYVISGLDPNIVTAEPYALRFAAPGAVVTTASMGEADSTFTNGPQQISDIIFAGGAVLPAMNLPITPNGVVYDTVERIPIPGAVLALRNSSTGALVPASCFDDPAQQGQVTLSNGFYKFDMNFSDPGACPSGGSYLIDASGATAGYSGGLSAINPPTTDATTLPFSVPACTSNGSDAVPGTGLICELQVSEDLPPATVLPRTAGSAFQAHLTLDSSSLPGSAQAFNNHIALDPALDAAVSITKSTPLRDVVLGQLVPYEITATNQLNTDLLDITIVDSIPAGFKYVDGSARLDGVPTDPTRNGRELRWSNLDIIPAAKRTVQLLLAVGAGVTDGEYVNQAEIMSSVGAVPLSGVATATVRVSPDPDFACTDVLGKVFDDRDRDGMQTSGELGLSGVRLVTPRGLVATTDEHGRFHITCAIVPAEGRGSNFVLKLDDRTLPSGYRMSTRTIQVGRATRGKALRFKFGASIHRVVGLDLADAAFEPDTSELRPQWRERIPLVIDELAESDSTLRISYIGDVESSRLVSQRVDAIEDQIREAWDATDGGALTIESEVYWRRGAPRDGFASLLGKLNPFTGSSAAPAGSGGVAEAGQTDSGERHLPANASYSQWMTDPEILATERGDRLEQREVLKKQARTVKLKHLVKPIRFEEGGADITPNYVANLGSVLDGMEHLSNVRLHFVGHADDQPLTPALAGEYGDNVGLSRERAGEVAEFVQTALELPAEAISFAWAGEAEPVATNATAEGRALNRRVEVEVWYDEYDETVAVEDFVVSDEIKRVKVCRIETVCKMSFMDGHERRSRVRNLVPPLRFGDQGLSVPEGFITQVEQAIENLREKSNVTVKFVGHTDSLPLEDREARIYGTHLALSKANARRVGLAIQDSLGLPTSAVASDGRGTARPIASNDTPRGRSLNRRVDVEFWYDDPLQELDDEPQLCPDAGDAEIVTQVYDPPWGVIPALPVEDGQVVIPAALDAQLKRAMTDVGDEENVRLRFVGYTANERLDRRTAMVYGDDVGLSTARAQRAMERVRASLELEPAQAEAEGRGFVHSEDVVNGGFVTEDASRVVVQVVYDEPAQLDDYEGVEITPITRELSPKDPLALNLMRISVDGKPIDDRDRSSADVQRCTDVALERAAVEFRFDGLNADRRLSVASAARTVATGTDSTPDDGDAATEDAGAETAETAEAADALRFRMYSNYGHYIERSEVRVFDLGDSLRDEPLAVVEVSDDGFADWSPDVGRIDGPVRELKFVLRAYDADGRYDETVPQSLWMVNGRGRAIAESAEPSESVLSAADAALRAGYGETEIAVANIDLGSAGTVRVQGGSVPEGHTVWIAGEAVPVSEDGEFIAEAVLPTGLQTVEVAVLDEGGNGELFLRDLEFRKSEWFYVAMADVTLSASPGGSMPDELQGGNTLQDPDSFADGRFAFFLTGRFGEDWRLTASADTQEGPIQDLFTNFLDKSPDALFRRMDPDRHYPTFGDDGTVEEMAPSSGKFFVKLDQGPNHALWGNFGVSYVDNEVARVERGLYGGNLHYQTEALTSFGEQRVVVDGFAADPGTVASREDFRGTGGSLYYLKHRDLLMGSERLRIEIRDKVTGLVTGVRHLSPDEDYDVDYFQGRILLARPISSTTSDELLVRNDGLSGNETYLVVQYEFAPGFDELDSLAAGGEGQVWLTDFLKVGVTAYRNSEDGEDAGLYAANLVARLSARTWMKGQVGYSDGLVGTTLQSNDGGFDFDQTDESAFADKDALAIRADLSLGFGDLFAGVDGGLDVYFQRLQAGYSVPGLSAARDTDFMGGTISIPLLDRLAVKIKADRVAEDGGLVTNAQEVDASFQLTDEISLKAGVRNDDRDDQSGAPVATQQEGGRTDIVVQVGFDTGASWSAYAFGQGTVRETGDRERNSRGGLGGAVRISDRLEAKGEVGYGDGGATVEVGTNYQQSGQTSRYLSYSLDNERATTGAHARRGNLVNGARTRLSDSASIYQEDRYQHTSADNGLSRAIGLDWSLSEQWTLGAEWEHGTLVDAQTLAETKRRSGGGRLSYHFGKLLFSSGIEYRSDETEQPDASWSSRTTWLFRNDFRLQMTPDWRMLGKLNHSFSDSSLGDVFDGGFTEAVIGYAYRPIHHDRLDVMAKYTYFNNVPTTDQVGAGGESTLFMQKSHVMSADVTYDVTKNWTLGGKYAYRLGQVSLDRVDPQWFDNSAHLYLARADWRFLSKWEGTLEGRILHMPGLNERKAGALITVYRYFGNHFKVGVGYNFTDFSEDLTDLSYDHHGLFFNIIGTL